MRILLLNPPFKTEFGRFSRDSRSPAITKSGTIYYPIWLCYVAGVLEEAGHKINIIDSCAYGYDLQRTIDLSANFKPELCVLNTSTPSIYSDIKIGADIKTEFPDCFVVLMGTHPTALPEETLRVNKNIDAIIVGEADYTARELAYKLSKSDKCRIFADPAYRENVLSVINGLAYRSADKIHVNNPRELIAELDKLPFVSKVYKKYLDSRKYFFAASDYPEVQIMTARGCIGSCTFCVYPQTIHKGKYRTRSAQNAADEFQWISENMPEVREVGIEDDTFTGDQQRVIDFCKELIARKISLKWYCNVRVDMKYEVMVWMKRAGCVLVTVGYESGSREVLTNVKKNITPEMIAAFSKNCKKSGLLVHSCFMAGNRGETIGTLAQSLRLALTLLDDTMQFFPLMAYPGTIDYEWAKESGLLTASDYDDYVTADGNHNSVIRMTDLDSNEIRGWCDYARRCYYLRPRYLFYKLFQQIKKPSEIRRTVKAAKRFIQFLIPGRTK